MKLSRRAMAMVMGLYVAALAVIQPVGASESDPLCDTGNCWSCALGECSNTGSCLMTQGDCDSFCGSCFAYFSCISIGPDDPACLDFPGTATKLGQCFCN